VVVRVAGAEGGAGRRARHWRRAHGEERLRGSARGGCRCCSCGRRCRCGSSSSSGGSSSGSGGSLCEVGKGPRGASACPCTAGAASGGSHWRAWERRLGRHGSSSRGGGPVRTRRHCRHGNGVRLHHQLRQAGPGGEGGGGGGLGVRQHCRSGSSSGSGGGSIHCSSSSCCCRRRSSSCSSAALATVLFPRPAADAGAAGQRAHAAGARVKQL
jgi:hypothetical protein